MTYPPQQPGPYGPGPQGSQPGGYGQRPGEYGQPGYGQPGYSTPPGGFGQPGYGGPGGPGGFGGQPPKKSRKGLVIGLIIALVVLLGGGTGAYFAFRGHGGTPTATRSGNPAGASDPLANRGTIDPCSGFTASTFSGIGSVEMAPASFSICEVLVTPTGGTDSAFLAVDVTFDRNISELDATQDSVTNQGSLRVVSQNDRTNNQVCYGYVYLSDTEAIMARAKPNSGNTGDVQLCGIVDTATKAVVSALQHNAFKHLSYPTGSLGALDACSVLDPSEVAGTLGGTGIIAHEYPGSRTCSWGTGTETDLSKPNVYFFELIYQGPDKTTDNPNENELPIIGRDTFVYPSGNTQQDSSQNECYAETAVKTWTKWPGQVAGTVPQTLVEYAQVDATVTGTSAQACQAATTLAGKAWANLPPPAS